MRKKIFNKLFNPLGNCELATYQLCNKLGIHVTRSFIKKQLEEHPDYPSLLSVSDILGSVGIANGAVQCNIDALYQFTSPLIAQIKRDNVPYFTVVSAMGETTIHILDPISEIDTETPKETFSKEFMGVVLLAEAGETSGQSGYIKAKKDEQQALVWKILSIVSIPSLAIIASAIAIATNGKIAIFPILFTLITLAGSLVGAILLWYEVDKHNPILKEICSGGKKVNCNAVLSSSASKIFGISWSTIGFSYFSGLLLSLLFSGITSQPVLHTVSIINLLALPYIVFSVYYQYKIAKQWCRLCLAVQVLIVFQFLVTMAGHFLSMPFLMGWQTYILIGIAFLVPFFATQILVPALQASKEGKLKGKELSRLKHNPEIFEALLSKQKQIDASSEGLGITLGNPNAPYKLIKVCNPYCGPCAKAHSAMEAVMDNNPNIQVQIIFTATSKENDMKTPPVKHLLAIAEKNNERETKDALDDWYLAENKDYETFATKYPMNGELKKQDEKIKAMEEWCNSVEITYTPTFFVNGYQLPEQYSVADLKYFHSV